MLRKSPLKRKTRPKPRSTTKKRRTFEEFAASPPELPTSMLAVAADTLEAARRREWVHRQPCVFGRVTGDPCGPGPIQEMHCDRGKGTGIKSPMPTFGGCARHHDMVSGAAKHPSVMPMEKLWRRAFEALASEVTERDWVEAQAHDARRKGLI